MIRYTPISTDLSDRLRQKLGAVLPDRHARLPADAELLGRNERVDLERHVLGEMVVGDAFHPRRFHLDQSRAVAGTVQVVVVVAPLLEELDVVLGHVGGKHAGLQLVVGPAMGVETELDDLPLAAGQFAHADRHADAGRVAVHLGREVQLHDVALLNLPVGGAGNGVARGLLAEDIHGQSFVFRPVLVNRLLRDAHQLQFGHARPDVTNDFLGGDFRDPQPFADAGDFVLRLDAPQGDHDVVGADDLAFGIALLQPFQLNGIGDQVSADADLQLLAL